MSLACLFRARRPIGTATLVCFALGAPVTGVALAEEKLGEANIAERRAQARAEFEKGARLYEEQRFQEAVEAFIEADRLAPSPALSFNIARAYERLDDTKEALRWYRDYLRRAPGAGNSDDVRATVRALEARSEPEPSLPVPASIPAAEPVPAEHAAQRTPASPSSETRFGVAPYIVAGGGAALLVGALGFELARQGHESKARDASSQIEFAEHVESMEDMKTASRVFLGLGTAAIVTGGVLYFLNDRRESPSPVAFGCTPQGCVASARGAF